MFTNKKITTNLSYCFYFAWICHEFCLYCFKKQVERWSKNEFLIQDCLVGISKMDLELPCKRIQLDSHCIVDSLWQSRNLLLLILVNIFLRLKDGNGTWFCGNRIFQHKIAKQKNPCRSGAYIFQHLFVLNQTKLTTSTMAVLSIHQLIQSML